LVVESRTITAGNGLTGGGDLSANQTIHLGTPNTLSRTTSNNTNSNRHQHAITTTQTGAGNTIVATDSAGDIRARLFRSSYGEQGSAPSSSADVAFRNSTSDNYIRFMTRAAARAYLGVPTISTSYNAVGTYVFARGSGSHNPGTTLSGSSLRATNANGDPYSSGLSGTWRCMGYTRSNNNPLRSTLWVRIS